MKIVYCLPQIYLPGGIERIVSIKANYLADAYNYDVTIIVANQKEKKPFYDLSPSVKLIDLAIDYESIKNYSIIKKIFYRRSFKKLHKSKLSDILLELRADVVISTFTNEADILPSIHDGSKKILECHFCEGYNFLYAKYFKLSLIHKIIYRIQDIIDKKIVIPKYDKFVVLTKEDKERWEKSVSNVVYIPNTLTFDEGVATSALKSHRAIAVGRLDGQKGFDRLINIWHQISARCPDWHLDIYGDGLDEFRLKDLIISLNMDDTITIHKPVKNIIDCYLNSSLLLMTSNYEGWGLVLTEAMQCGLPVVAFACPCGPKDIITDGSDGFCIANNDKETFVQKAIELMSDSKLRESFGKSAVENIQRYSVEIVMKSWVNLFKE